MKIYCFNEWVGNPETRKRIGAWAINKGFDTVVYFTQAAYDASQDIIDDLKAHGLTVIIGYDLCLHTGIVRPRLTELLDVKNYILPSRLHQQIVPIYCEGWAGMNDFNNKSMFYASTAAYGILNGCRQLMNSGYTPWLCGPCWRPVSYPITTPYGFFMEILLTNWNDGMYLMEEFQRTKDGVPLDRNNNIVNNFNDHPLLGHMIPLFQNQGNWGGVTVDRAFAQAKEYGVDDLFIYYSDPERQVYQGATGQGPKGIVT